MDIQCQLDAAKEDGKPNVVKLSSRQLGDIDHAFATTVHRSQGMTVDSVIAVPGTFISKELFYVMATRHRERLSVHMLESDRAFVMVKAAKSISKLHSLDLVGVERAGGQATSGLWGLLQASGEKFVAWMQKERARFEGVFAHATSMKRAAPILNSRPPRRSHESASQIKRISERGFAMVGQWQNRQSGEQRQDRSR